MMYDETNIKRRTITRFSDFNFEILIGSRPVLDTNSNLKLENNYCKNTGI